MEKNRFASSLPVLGEAPPIKKSALLKQLSSEQDPPVNTFDDIRGYVTMYKNKHEKDLLLSKREKAIEVHSMMINFSNNAQRSIFNRRCKTALTNLRGKMNETRSDEVNVNEETTENEKNFETSAQKRWDSMKARQNAEMEKLMKSKPIRSETPAAFRRRSPELLALLRYERNLFLQSRFDEASKLGAECKKRDMQEQQQQYDNEMRQWNIQKKHLEEKHAREESAMLDWIKERRDEYSIDRKSQVEALEKRKKILDYEITDRSTLKKTAAPHLIRRNIYFDNHAQSRGLIQSTPQQEELDKLYLSLSDRSHQILQRKLSAGSSS